MLVVLGRAVLVHFRKPLLGAKAVVCVAALYKLLRVVEVNLLALGLNVRSVIAADERTFVVLHARLVERGNYYVHRARHLAGLVGVLYAQYELAAVLFGEKIRVKRGAQAAYMKIPRGAGCKSGANHVLSLTTFVFL